MGTIPTCNMLSLLCTINTTVVVCLCVNINRSSPTLEIDAELSRQYQSMQSYAQRYLLLFAIMLRGLKPSHVLSRGRLQFVDNRGLQQYHSTVQGFCG